MIPLSCLEKYLTDDFLGCRIDGGELLAADGIDELVVDKQLGELDLGLHGDDVDKKVQFDTNSSTIWKRRRP